MTRKTLDVALDFVNQEQDYGKGSSVHYNGHLFYSYATVVAQIVKGKDNGTYCLLSNNNMSMITSKHLGNLVSACIRTNTPIIRVACDWYDRYEVTPTEYANRQIKDLNYYVENKDILTKKPNRTEFISIYVNTQELIETLELDIKIPQEITDLYNNLFNVEFVKSLRKRKVA
jgi:hypothetical protein